MGKVAGAIGSLQPAAAIIEDMMRQATQVMGRYRGDIGEISRT